MKILFCNIVWMKKYQGITDDDKPKYCGAYVSEQTAGADIFNFRIGSRILNMILNDEVMIT